MALTDYLPLSHLPDVRERVDQLFSREMLGGVLVGKFVGLVAAGDAGQKHSSCPRGEELCIVDYTDNNMGATV